METQMNNSWVIYEIPGYKVGMCKSVNYPSRPKMQVNKLKGISKGTAVGDDNFKALQYLHELTRVEALDVEEEWQDKLGYVSDRAKLSAAKIGKPLSEEHKAKLSTVHKEMDMSEEHKANLRAAHVGRVPSDEARAKMSAASKGRVHSEETKAKISAASKGKTLSEEHKVKLYTVNKGKTLSEETKAKLSAHNTGRKASDETRAKMSAAQQEYQRRKREGDTDGNK